jgi:hypothetical protein
VTAPVISLNGYVSMGNNWFGQWWSENDIKIWKYNKL